MDIDLIAIRLRCEAATPGPWFVSDPVQKLDKHMRSGGSVAGAGHKDVVIGGYDWNIGTTGVAHEEDIEFIAHAREDVPALLAHIERLTQLLDNAGIPH